MSKKKIFALIVFIVFGLFMFSFANPADLENTDPFGNVEVDKTKLKNAIDRGDAILNIGEINPELKKELEDALKDGNDVYEGEATQTEVDDATKKIEEVIKKIEDDIMNRATISLVPNTLTNSVHVNLITTVTIDDSKFIDYVKLVEGTNCNANGTVLTLNGNNQAVTTVNNNSTYTSCLVLTNGATKQASVTVNNIVDRVEEDTVAPLVTLNGNDLVKIVLGKTTYEDELAKVTDNVDDDREIAGELVGKTDEIGTYEFKYNATDEAGNKALEVTRTIKVLDPDGDEDGDGFTNGEEVDAGTDFDDENSYPETEAPTIILKGNNPYNMLTGETYSEAGVEITLDSHDKETTIDDVTYGGEVNSIEVGNYNLTYTITDKYGKTAKTSREVRVYDANGDEDGDGFTNKEEKDEETDMFDEESHPETDAPTITLKGNNPYTMLTDETYSEAGVEITLDAHDKKTTIDDVKYEGTVLETTAGTYELTYTITDRYGKTATTNREVKVYDANGDEDGDGFTNREEKDEETDMFDENSHPETDAPTITLKGNNPYIMLTDETYSEAGVEITLDAHDKKTTIDDVKYEGTVLETTAGTYELTYTITDRYGKTATTNREVRVYDANGDEDGDGFTNREEKDEETDMFDENSHPETEAPTITLKGETPIYVKVFDKYVEQGVEITLDSHDKITGVTDVVIAGSVNTELVKEYEITYTITDRYGKSASVSRKVIVSDTESPVIYLNGDDTITVQRGSKYEELGATVTDNYDKNISAVISGEVDTTTLGTYPVKYNAVDSSNNKATEVIRTVVVVRSDNDKKVASIEATLNPTIYNRGTENYGTLTVVATDNDGLTHTLDASEYEVTGWDSTLEVGKESVDKNLTVTLKSNKEVSDTVNYTVVRSEIDKVLNRIEATLTKTEYKRGEEISTLVVTAYDNDGTSYDVTNLVNHNFDSSTVGNKTLIVAYKGKTCDTAYTVVRNDEDKVLNRIEATLTKTEYQRGEEISTLVVTAYDNDGTSYDVTNLVNHDFDSSTVGNKTLTVTYNEKSDNLHYTVVRSDNDKMIASIKATLNPTIYNRGTENYGTLTVVATDNDGLTHTLDASEYEVTGWDSTLEVGKESADRNLTVTLTSNKEVSDTVNYTVVRSESDKVLNRIEATLTKTEYKRGEEISTLVVTAYDNDGTSYDVTNLSGHDFDSNTVGDKTLTVTYSGKNDTVSYRVVRNDNDKIIASIEATLNPTIYDRGTANYGTLTVVATDNDGVTHTLDASEYEVTGWDSTLEVGKESVDRSLTVTLKSNKELSDTVNYTVVRSESDKALDRIEATLTKTEYKRGEEISTLVVTAYDNDGTSYDVTNLVNHDFDSNTVGDKTLTVTYNEKNDTASYTVVRNDNDKIIASIEATLNPTTYDRGTENYGTLTVVATDNDGLTHTLDASEYEVTGWDSTLEVGKESVDRNLTVTLTLNKEVSDTASYTIVRSESDKQIKSLTAVLEKDVYKRGETMSNIVVTRTDNDGTQSILTNEQYTVTGFETTTVGGPYTVTVSHDGLTATDTYTVGDIEVNISTPTLNVSGKKAEPGQTVDYAISLQTDMDNVYLPVYTIEVADGMALVCPQKSNVTCAGNVITWKPNDVNETLNYQTVVDTNIAAGTEIKTTVKENDKVVKEFDTQVEVTVEVSSSSTSATSLEVVLTLDVSGSMWEEECTGGWFNRRCVDKPTKITDLANVTKQFITDLNTKNVNGSTINLTIITFGRRKDNYCYYQGTCYETLYQGNLTNNTLESINNKVNTIIGTEPNTGGTHLYGAVNSALNIINNSQLQNKYLVVLGDGAPTDDDNYGVISALQATSANVFSIGFKVDAGSKAETVLKNIVNNKSENYFNADNATSLENSFATIQDNINTDNVQTDLGNVSASAASAKSITLSYSGLANPIEITNLTETELAKYNIVIVDNQFVWDVSKYPGYTDFKMIVRY